MSQEVGQSGFDQRLPESVTIIDSDMKCAPGWEADKLKSNVINERMRREVEEWVDRMLEKGVKGLLNEFAELRTKTNPSARLYQHFTHNEPFGRNRYKDVFCLDESRIVLHDHPNGNDYIHANYVSTPLMSNRFICTQAPKEETVYDFWLMIIQEQVEIIVMLGDFIEKGKEKCAQYFPCNLNETFTTNDVQIQCVSVTKLPEFQHLMLQRLLKITRNGQSLNVTHYHWSQWPDHSVPVADRAPLRLFQMVRTAKRPICVHCSAGIGRTGSVVTIAYIIECFLTNSRFEDLAEILQLLRQQRAGIVQTAMQYLYVHRIMLIYFADMRLISASDRLNKFIREYDELVSTVQ
ncbi:unnamed protein product [Toxocara canis]|uniref:Protein-tyrosine phosphatase n=1 Tax=Toxocara canis TaxID=6265 RepID=A0A183UK58_TOXCA|nr:unnamed protein product [Toxocara canis]